MSTGLVELETRIVQRREQVEVARSQQARMSAWLALLVLTFGFVIAPPGSSDALPSTAVGRVLSGTLELAQVDQVSQLLNAGDLVPNGADVRALDGEATLDVRGGVVSLQRGTTASLSTGVFEVRTGSILFEVDASYTVQYQAFAVRGQGSWRIDATSNPRLAVYEGAATIVGVETATGTRALVVPGLQQVELRDPTLPEEPTPLQYFAFDPWDTRLMADAIEIDRQVEAQQRGLERTYGDALRSLDFYDDFVLVDGELAAALGRLAPRALGESYGPPADTLVGVVVTQVIIDRAARDAVTAIDTVARMRDDGAAWGLVLVGEDLGPEDLRGAFNLALRNRAQEVADNPPVAPAPSDEPSGPPAPGPTPSPQPTPTPSPTPSPSPGPSEGPVSDLVPDPLEDLVGDVEDQLPGDDEPISDLVDELDDVVEDTLPPDLDTSSLLSDLNAGSLFLGLSVADHRRIFTFA